MQWSLVPPVWAADDLEGGLPPENVDCLSGVEGIDLGGCFSLGTGKTVGGLYNQPTDLVNLIVRNLFVIGGFILFLMVIYAGFKFISGGTKGKDEAKTIMTTAVVGFIIMFAAYWIVQIIKIVTGANIIL